MDYFLSSDSSVFQNPVWPEISTYAYITIQCGTSTTNALLWKCRASNILLWVFCLFFASWGRRKRCIYVISSDHFFSFMCSKFCSTAILYLRNYNDYTCCFREVWILVGKPGVRQFVFVSGFPSYFQRGVFVYFFVFW